VAVTCTPQELSLVSLLRPALHIWLVFTLFLVCCLVLQDVQAHIFVNNPDSYIACAAKIILTKAKVSRQVLSAYHCKRHAGCCCVLACLDRGFWLLCYSQYIVC